jgi:hypothetical protein
MERLLRVTTGKPEDREKVFHLPESGLFTIGRGNDTNTRLSDGKVSRIHCQLEVDGDVVKLVHKSSTASTYVNEELVRGERVLQSGDVIRIGETHLRYDGDVHMDATLAGDVPPLGEAATVAGSGPVGVAAAAAPPMAELIGTTLGHYTITRFLGEGHRGVSFLAHDNRGIRQVVLQVLKPGMGKSEAQVQALARSLQKVLQLQHSNLVALVDLGVDQGKCWFAYENVEGETLSDLLQKQGIANLVPWERALQWGIQLARGLEHLHQNQVVHGRINPQCIVVGAIDRAARLADLDQAQPIETARQKPPGFRPDAILPFVAYCAPECARGDIYADERSDVYGLGATLYALVAGRPPFQCATPAETLIKVLHPNEPPPRPRQFRFELPEAFEKVLMRMLGKRPDDRYPSMTEVVADLEKVAAGGRDIAAPPDHAGPPTEGTIAVTCGGCGQKLRARRKFIGTQVKCPRCARLLLVPEYPGVVAPADAPIPTLEPAAPAREGKPKVPDRLLDSNSPRLPSPLVVAVVVLIVVMGAALFLYTHFFPPTAPSTQNRPDSPPGQNTSTTDKQP